MARLEQFFRGYPQGLTIHDLEFQASAKVEASLELPEEIWVSDSRVAGKEIYIPCRSYCWPTLFLHWRPNDAAVGRSALDHDMDPLPVGFWRELKVATE